MYSLPIEFRSEAEAGGEFSHPWTIVSGQSCSFSAVPAEFGGHGGGFSPEDLFLQAAINCFIGTFKVVAKMSKVSFSNVQVKGRLRVDKNSEGKTVMSAVHLDIEFQGVDRPDRVEAIVAKAIRDGFIINSIKSEISYSLSYTSSTHP